MEAIKRATRAKTIQRSIQLTPFGEDFCEVCLPLDTAEMEDLSEPAAALIADGPATLSSLDRRKAVSDQGGQRWTT